MAIPLFPALLSYLPSSVNMACCGFSGYSSQELEPKCLPIIYPSSSVALTRKRHVNSLDILSFFHCKGGTVGKTPYTYDRKLCSPFLSSSPKQHLRRRPRDSLLPFRTTANYVFQSPSKQHVSRDQMRYMRGFTR